MSNKFRGLDQHITALLAECEPEHARLNWTPPQPSAVTVALLRRIETARKEVQRNARPTR